MNPMLMALMQGANQQATTSGAQPMAPDVGSSDTLAALLGSVQAQQPHMTPMPYTTTPDAPRAINPALSQNIMQMLMGLNRPQMPTLGSLLAGRT